MNIVSMMVKGGIDFVVLNVVAVPFINDPALMLWYSLSVLLAFILRLGIEYNENNLTWRSAFIQTVYTISYCYLAIIVWFTYLNYGKGFEVYLFFNSLFAFFMVKQVQVMFKFGIKAWGRKWLRSLVAAEPTEEENS